MTPALPPRAPGQQPDGVRPARPGRDHLSEYGEMIAEIARGPRRTLWQRFTIALAGHGR